MQYLPMDDSVVFDYLLIAKLFNVEEACFIPCYCDIIGDNHKLIIPVSILRNRHDTQVCNSRYFDLAQPATTCFSRGIIYFCH